MSAPDPRPPSLRTIQLLALVVACGLPVGLVIGYEVGLVAEELGGDRLLWGTTAGVLLGTVGGAGTALTIRGLRVAAREREQHGSTASPHQVRELSWSAHTAELSRNVEAALREATRGRAVERSPDGEPVQRWTARTRMSLMTFGEHVSVSAAPCLDHCACGGIAPGAGTTTGWHVLVASRPVVSTTLVDHGAASRTVEAVTRALEAAGARLRRSAR